MVRLDSVCILHFELRDHPPTIDKQRTARRERVRHQHEDRVRDVFRPYKRARSLEVGGEAELVLVIGSQNSSNSKRLVEMAHQEGKPAYLIDDESELDPAWLEGVQCVFVTAGASAPERLVSALIERLKREFGGEIEERTLVEEDIQFELPKTLRKLAVVK